jgi:antitoxin HicB
MRYTVVLARDGDGFVAYVPVIPGCVTQGDTVEEAIAMAQDAAEGMLAVMAEYGEEIPEEEPGTVVASIEVAVPALAPA